MTQKVQEIRAPAHLSRFEKGQFRAVNKRLSAAGIASNEAQTPLICDLIEIDGRLKRLEVLISRVAAKGIEGTIISDYLALSSQINATMALRHKVERRLGL
jgi:hypothetical protein